MKVYWIPSLKETPLRCKASLALTILVIAAYMNLYLNSYLPEPIVPAYRHSSWVNLKWKRKNSSCVVRVRCWAKYKLSWKMNDKRNCKHPCWSLLLKASSFWSLLSTQNLVFKKWKRISTEISTSSNFTFVKSNIYTCNWDFCSLRSW